MHGRVLAALVGAVWLFGAPLVAGGQDAAAPAAVGTISGVVLDKGTGDPIIDAGVELVDQKKTARTDIDGKYVFKVPEGTYQIRIFAAGYQAVRLQAVTVVAGQVSKADAALAASGPGSGLVVEVTAQANKAAEATQLLKRQKAAVVSDTISAETIKKAPGSLAADVVTRAPGVAVRGEKFIYVRGLGERYSSALLNGSRLPSTDPEKRAVPLDLFPAGFLDSISIVKTYTPDLPGDFSGGLAEIDLRDFPDTFAASMSLGTGGNTQATAQTFNSDGLSGYDWMTFGTQTRHLPEDVPPTGFYNFQTIDSLPMAQELSIARSFGDNWAVKTQTAPPNASGSFAVGDSIGPFGFQFASVYNNEWQHRRNEIQRQYTNSGGAQGKLAIRDNFVGDTSVFIARLGSLFTSALKLGDDHKITFRSLWNRTGNNNLLLSTGNSFNDPSQVQNQTRFRYTQETLAYGQFAGEDHFKWVDVEWRSAFSRTTANEPDTRFLVYQSVPPAAPEFTDDSLGGQRLFNSMWENLSDSGVDFTIPFRTALPFTDVWSGLAAKFKFGAAYSYQWRAFQQRRFRYTLEGDLFDLTQPAQWLLQPSHIGPGGFDFTETSVPRDQYQASQEIGAGYGMFDLPLVRDTLRLIAGTRLESSYISLLTFDDQGFFEHVTKNNLNPLPGINLVYTPRKDMNIRAAYSQSVSRPEFRELSPAFYPAPRGLYGVIGNPALVQANVTSYDLRWEWFFSPLEVASIGFFYKQFDKPIEPTLTFTSGAPAYTWVNAVDGTLIGYELEARKNFAFVTPRLEPLNVLLNVTGSGSNVNVPSTSTGAILSRPLVGQSPWLINAVLEYTDAKWGTARILYTTAGPTLAAIGLEQLPDLYDQPRNQLDAVYVLPLKPLLDVPMTAQLTVQNILNDPYVRTQGGQVANRFTTGVKFTFSMSYAF